MNFIEKIENLEGLDSLEQLILFGNRIRVLENLDGLGNLKVLKINNNRLLTISELALYDFHSLQVLHAADNIIDTDELESCIKTVLSLEALQELSLYGNLVADDPTYKFAFSDHTNLVKLDGLELKPAVKQKFQSMKKDYEIDKLVETTKEEYFKRIEAERELKVAAANMLKKQQKSITDQYDNFIEYMERDFDGFINYVYDLKKRKDLGQENEITDIDLYQWRKTLQEKEEERLRLLEEALNGIESKEKFMLGSQILSSDKEEAYKASMPFPNMASQLDKKGVYMEIDPEKRQMYPPPSNKSRIDDALDGYEKFKDEDYKAKEKHQQIMNDPSIGDLNYQPPPPDIPNLRDPRLRELYQEEDKNNLEPDNNFKNLGETGALDQNKYYNEHQNPHTNPLNGQEMPQDPRSMPREESKDPQHYNNPNHGPNPNAQNPSSIDQSEAVPLQSAPSEPSKGNKKKKNSKKSKDKKKKQQADPQNQSGQDRPPKKKSKGCLIF